MLARKIALNTVISASARVVGTLLALMTVGLLTRYFSKTDWGEYSIVLTFGGIFAVLADLGFYQLLVREISREGVDESRVASQIFSLKLIGSFFIFSLAPVISLFFPYSAQARWGIALGMAAFWLLGNCQVLMGIFQKYLRMDKVALAEVGGRLAQILLVYFFIKLDYGFLPLVLTLSLSSLVNFVWIFIAVRRYVRLRFSFDWPAWRRWLRLGYPLAVASVLTMIYFSTDSLILSVFRPASEVGAYRLPYKILESLIFFPSMFVGLIMPFLSRYALVDQPRFLDALRRGYEILIIFAVPLVAGTFFVSPTIINLLGGQQYPESVVVLNILMVAVGAIFLGTLFSFALIALEKQKSLLKISAVGAIFNLVFNLIFIPRYSYYAAAATTVLTELLVMILMAIMVCRVSGFRLPMKILGKSLLAVLPMILLLWWLKMAGFGLLFLLAGAALTYFGALALWRGFNWREVLSLTSANE